MDHISKYTSNMNILTDRVNQKIIISFILGIVVGLGGFWMFNATKAINKVAEDTQQEFTEIVVPKQESVINKEFSSSGLVKNDSIVVLDQPAGNTVVFEKVIFEDSGWVVIHEGTISRVGNALGAARFDAGEYSGTVSLLRPTKKGEVYRAVLYHDNGDKEFNLDSDFPILQNVNEPVLTMFIVQ